MAENLIQPIPPSIESGLREMLTPDETVFVKLKGAFKEVLVCTNKRVVILKSGFQTGHWFGLRQFQLPLASVSSAEVSATMGVGFIEISAGGVQNVPKSYWAQSKERSAQKAPNCVSISGSVKAFRAASTVIMEKADEARNPRSSNSPAPTTDISTALAALWRMKNEGALTQSEYEAAKTKIIG